MEFTSNLPVSKTDPKIPIPKADHDLRLTIDLNAKISVGPSEWGHRNWISFTGGRWTATWGKGTVEPGGQDSQLVTSNYATRIETSYLLRTDAREPAYICVKTHGWRTGPPEVLQALMDPSKADQVDPEAYKFRLYVDLETGDDRYRFVNTSMWVGSGVRKGAQVVYDAYRIS